MKNKSPTAISLLVLFTVSIAASAATQFAPEKKADKNEKSIDKRKIKVPTWGYCTCNISGSNAIFIL